MISEETNNEDEQQPSYGESAPEVTGAADSSAIEAEESGPGPLLSRRREALGMSVQQVADELHITMHYVRALETNAHDKLPGDIFIRGYLRSYAKLLKMDPMVLINVYNEYTNQQETAAEANNPRGGRRRDRNLPWIVVSGIAFVGIAIALWYFSSRDPAQTSPGTGAVSPSPEQNIVPARPLSNGVTPTIDNVGTTLLTDVAPALADEQAVVSGGSAIAGSTTSEADAGFGEGAALEEDGEGSSEVMHNHAPKPSRVISIDAGGEDLVQITFSGESMVQVDDGNAQQIYRDIRTAGDVLRITGSAPFNILLGDAAATELSLNGNKIDFTSSIRIDNSARLTIGL